MTGALVLKTQGTYQESKKFIFFFMDQQNMKKRKKKKGGTYIDEDDVWLGHAYVNMCVQYIVMVALF